MNKPDPKDYPPESPHDIEWGGVSQQYYSDLIKWEQLQYKPVFDAEKIQTQLNSLNTIYNQAIDDAIEVAKNIYSGMDYEPRMERLISELTKLKK